MQKIVFLLSAFLITNSAYAASASISTQTEVWFSPQGGARDAILESIAGAKKEIHVGAYKLEDKIIAQALVDAKDRGVEVSIILDKKKSKYKTSLKKWLVKQNVPVFTDPKHFLYHNKVIIIDGTTVLTGSFNFKADAEDSNAENLLRLDSPELAEKFSTNWEDTADIPLWQNRRACRNKDSLTIFYDQKHVANSLFPYAFLLIRHNCSDKITNQIFLDIKPF